MQILSELLEDAAAPPLGTGSASIGSPLARSGSGPPSLIDTEAPRGVPGAHVQLARTGPCESPRDRAARRRASSGDRPLRCSPLNSSEPTEARKEAPNPFREPAPLRRDPSLPRRPSLFAPRVIRLIHESGSQRRYSSRARHAALLGLLWLRAGGGLGRGGGPGGRGGVAMARPPGAAGPALGPLPPRSLESLPDPVACASAPPRGGWTSSEEEEEEGAGAVWGTRARASRPAAAGGGGGAHAPPTVRRFPAAPEPAKETEIAERRLSAELLASEDSLRHRLAEAVSGLQRALGERDAARCEARDLVRVAKANEERLLRLHERLEIAHDLNEELQRQVEHMAAELNALRAAAAAAAAGPAPCS
eukprot:tig00020723_g13494.t1